MAGTSDFFLIFNPTSIKKNSLCWVFIENILEQMYARDYFIKSGTNNKSVVTVMHIVPTP